MNMLKRMAKGIVSVVGVIVLCAGISQAGSIVIQTEPYADPIAKQFKFYSATDCAAPKPWVLKTTLPIVTPSTYTITGVSTGTSCWYLTATDAEGAQESSPSNTVTVNMPLAPPKNVIITITINP